MSGGSHERGGRRCFDSMSKRTVVTIGNFDGVHLGHRKLIESAKDIARTSGGDVVAVTFEDHPLVTLNPSVAPLALMQRDQKAEALMRAGVDRIEWLGIERSTFELSAREFVEQVVERLDPVVIIEGKSFRFGCGRKGTPSMLSEMSSEMGFTVHVHDTVSAVLRDKTVVDVSSSLIRWLVARGRVVDAAICMGGAYVIRGIVVEGEGRGRELGFATINVECGRQLLPGDGVYAGEVVVDGVKYLAGVSVGSKRTFGDGGRTCEAHLLDFKGDLYGRSVDVSILRWLRDQQAFGSVDGVKKRISADVAKIRELAGCGMVVPLKAGWC